MEKCLYFNGHSCHEFCAHIEHKPDIPVPERKYEEYEVPGRNGKLHADQGYYGNITISYQLYFHGRRPTAEWAQAVKQWFLGEPGAHVLSDDYFPGMFYNAVAKVGGISNILDKYGRFTVEFDCDPRHFLQEAQTPVELTNGQTLFNPYQQTAAPYFELTGTGAEAQLVVNGTTFVVQTYADKKIICDADNWGNAYLEDGTNVNLRTGGIWPELAPGENKISWTDGITSVTMAPRWWTL